VTPMSGSILPRRRFLAASPRRPRRRGGRRTRVFSRRHLRHVRTPGAADNACVELDRRILDYYNRGEEVERLAGGFPSGPLERARTEVLLSRSLPPPPASVLDVGGGPGVYAAWLGGLGYRVHVVDPVPLHIEQAAAHAAVTAELGDARALSQPDSSVDAVLLLGPLYHLVDKDDRIRAVEESHRVLKPGGLLFGAAISRFAALLDLLIRADRLHEPEVFRMVEASVETGIFGGPGENELFTTSYFHRPQELAIEIAEAGFTSVKVLQIEGPGALLTDFAERWSDPARRKAILDAAALIEDEPDLMGASSHLMAIANRD
jgi:SAM-dependent methyltransferase